MKPTIRESIEKTINNFNYFTVVTYEVDSRQTYYCYDFWLEPIIEEIRDVFIGERAGWTK